MARAGFKHFCSGEGCENYFVPSRWGNQHAQNLGWFLQKNGDAWCPDCTPEWVSEWRKKKTGEK